MIFWYGLTSELEVIRRHLTNQAALQFREIPDENVHEPLETAELLLIGPSVAKPVTLIQRVVARDKHISIIVLADSLRYNQVKRSIQFSFGMGKTSSCVVFNPDWDYTSIFEKAVLRTRQKRSFVKFNRSADQLLSIADSPAARLENLSEILEHAPVGVLLVDDALNVLAANRMSRTMFRVLDQKPVPLYTLLPASYAERLRAFGEHPGTPTLTVEDHSGNYYEVIGSAIPGKMEKQLLLLISDITEKYGKDLRFTAVLESLPHIAWAADAGGHINYYNRGWYEYTNTEPTEGMGDRWQSIVHPDDLQQFKQHWDEAVREGKVFQHATRLKRYDGEYRWHLSKAVPIFSKNRLVTMWVGTGTDIHEQVRRNEELERKVKERTKLLEETNAELENSLKNMRRT